MFALRFRDRLHLVLGFSAGAVIGVAFFDLLPEAISLGSGQFSTPVITAITALGFTLYLIIDRLILIHGHDEISENTNYRGKIGAGSLAIHSFLDGLAIGLAFKVSTAVGAIVSVAVLVHDFSDGINTVNLILKNSGSKAAAFKWLLLDALAPVLGALSTLFFSVSETMLGLILALFAGFFLYIGASDLLPESHHRHPTIWTTISTILGIVVLYTAIRLANL